MLVYLVRHTQPALPDERWRFVGRSDPPLSPLGIEQARRLAASLSAARFDHLYSSDLQRCLLTAEIIAGAAARPAGKGGVPVLPDARLREIDAGLWEGLTREEAAERYPAEYEARERDPVHCRFPGGESFDQVRDRVVPAFFELAARGGEKILMVTHKGVIRVLLCEALGLPIDRLFSLRQDYGSVNVLELSQGLDGCAGRLGFAALP
jgi:alpha-ribazole phosphatase